MHLTFRETNELSILAADMAEVHGIKTAKDLEELSRLVHAAVEEGFTDYVWDMEHDPGYETLKDYEVQYQ